MLITTPSSHRSISTIISTLFFVATILTTIFMAYPLKATDENDRTLEAIQNLIDLPTQFLFDESLRADGIVMAEPIVPSDNEIEYSAQRNAWARAQHGLLGVEKFSVDDFGKALSGEGISVGVWDGGLVLGTHKQLEQRVKFGELPGVDVLGTPRIYNRHATHVAGTIGANGVNSPSSEGMATSAKIVSFDFTNNLSEIATELKNGILISNHSYGPVYGWRYLSPNEFPKTTVVACNGMLWVGHIDDLEDPRFGRYVSNTREIDEILYNNPDHLAVVAAGNEAGIVDDPEAVYEALVSSGTLQAAPGAKWDGTHCAYNSTGGEKSVVVTKQIRPRDGGPDKLDLIGGMGVAKNVLTVGAAIDLDIDFDDSDITITNFSSAGPVDDGRIKPDVIANGELLKSLTVPAPCLTVTGCIARNLTDAQKRVTFSTSGTSMSSPVTTGIAALLAEFSQWDQVNERSLSAAELKAVIIYGVDSPTGDGAPTYRYGWGMIDALESYSVLDPNSLDSNLSSVAMAPGESKILETVMLSDPNRGLRTTVVWTDQPGTTIATNTTANLRARALVNDFDTMLLSPSGKRYFPWSLNPDTPNTAAENNKQNKIDNVEVIDVSKEAFEPGKWRLIGKASSENAGTINLAIVAGHVPR